MIKAVRLKTLSAALMLVLFLVGSFIGAEGTLLCFGKDGHVAIELVDACNRAGAGSELEHAEDDACGPCTDIQFQSSPAYTRNTLHDSQTLSLIYSSPVLSFLPQKDDPGNPVILRISSHHKALVSLQSVVLLI